VVVSLAATPEGNLWCAYGERFQSFVDDIQGSMSITPPYATLKTIWDLTLPMYGFTGAKADWINGLFRAVEVTIEIEPGVSITLVVLDTDIWLDMLDADGSAYGEFWNCVELAHLPSLGGGTYGWDYTVPVDLAWPAALKFP